MELPLSLAVGLAADERCRAGVLQAACQQLRRGSRAAVHQNDNLAQRQRIAGRIGLLQTAHIVAVAHAGKLCILDRCHNIGHFERRVDQAAAVAAQVENDRTGVLGRQAVPNLRKRRPVVLRADGADLDVLHTVRHRLVGNVHAVDLTALTGNGDVPSVAAHGQLDRRAFLAAQLRCYIGIFQLGRVLTVDFHDKIANLQTGFLRR